jgi:rhodanese-related sulfurtransferase
VSRTPRTLLVALLATTTLTLTACSSDPAPPAADTSAQVQTVGAGEAQALIDDGAAVIDVRTPEEFATGHLRGAANIDVTAADFHERVGRLDPDATYVVYCRSGSRAGAAAEMMTELGFTDVVNAGGYDDLAAAGLATR